MIRKIAAASVLLAGCNIGAGRIVTSQTDSLAARNIDLLEVYAGEGDLEILGCDGADTIEATADLMTHRPGQGADGGAIDALIFGIEDRGNGVARLRAELAGAPSGYSVDAYVCLPPELLVQVDDSSGDVIVDGVARLDLTDESGDIDISDISGDVFVLDDSGDLSVSQVGGDVDIDDGSGDIDVRSVGGQVTIRDESGDIVVEDSSGVAILEDGSGDVVIR